MDTRIDFWRQQEPLYARKNKKLPPKKPAQQQKPADTTKYILRSLEEIDEALADGEPEDSLKKAQSTLKTVQSLGAESVPNKAEVIGNLYSCIGNAYLEMDNYDEALKYHEKDLKAAKKRLVKYDDLIRVANSRDILFNPLNPNINMYLLHIVLHTFLNRTA